MHDFCLGFSHSAVIAISLSIKITNVQIYFNLALIYNKYLVYIEWIFNKKWHERVQKYGDI